MSTLADCMGVISVAIILYSMDFHSGVSLSSVQFKGTVLEFLT